MIARPLPLPEPGEPRRRSPDRRGRAAAFARERRRARARYIAIVRTATFVTISTLVIVTYLALMANVTRMNYELARDAETKARLSDEGARLDDRIARLESRERLAALAAKLGMHDSQTFAVVALPVAPDAAGPAHLSFLSWLK